MPIAIVEQIRCELVQRVNSLLVVGAECTTASSVVEPQRIGDYRPQDLQFLITQGDTNVVEAYAMPGNPPATGWETTFYIRARIMTSETEATKRDHIKNQVAADVVKVVCDYPYWHTFGGLCIDSSWGNHELIEADNGTTYLSLPIVVTYRTNENDPYVLRT